MGEKRAEIGRKSDGKCRLKACKLLLQGDKPKQTHLEVDMDIEVKRNRVFEPCWRTKCRYVAMKGSAGSGKSCDTATFYIVRLLSQRGRNLLCIRKSEITHKSSTYNELCKAIKRLGAEQFFDCKVSPLKITCTLGGEIIFCGVNDEAAREKLKSVTASSGSITDVWIEEATELTQSDFEIIDDRLRGRLDGDLFYQIRLTFNPVSASHWIKRAFFDKSDPDVLAHHSTYLDNAFCDEAYHKRMARRAKSDPDGYRVYGLGEWGMQGGVILSNFVEESLNQDLEQYDSVRMGQDFGFNHANALLLVGLRDGEIYVLRELYLHGKTTDEVIAMAADWRRDIPMLCDSAEPDRIVMWQRAGFRAKGVKKYPGSVKAAIDWLKARKIHIDSACTATIGELSAWSWLCDQNGDLTDVPTPYHDDAAAALRYAVSEWMFPAGKKRAARPRGECGMRQNII